MAKFTSTSALDMEWRGQRIVGPAGATHRISDALYDAFVADFVTGKTSRAVPGLVWVEDDEVAAVVAGEGQHPDLAAHQTLGLITQAAISSHEATSDPHVQYALDADLANHEAAGHAHNHDATYAGTVHTHAESSVTGLVSDLAGKAAAIHSHAHSDLTGVTADQHHVRQHAVTSTADHAFPGGTTNFLRADGAWAAPPAGQGGEAFPLGSIFLSVVSTDPATLLGYGTWSQIAGGRFLVGQGGSYPTPEATGGADTHTHPTHASGGAHAHADHTGTRKGGTSNPASILDGVVSHDTQGGHTHDAHSTESNVPPYLVVYVWKRTA